MASVPQEEVNSNSWSVGADKVQVSQKRLFSSTQLTAAIYQGCAKYIWGNWHFMISNSGHTTKTAIWQTRHKTSWENERSIVSTHRYKSSLCHQLTYTACSLKAPFFLPVYPSEGSKVNGEQNCAGKWPCQIEQKSVTKPSLQVRKIQKLNTDTGKILSCLYWSYF